MEGITPPAQLDIRADDLSGMEFLSTPDDNGTITKLEEGTEGRRLVDVINPFYDYCNPRIVRNTITGN
ncbi:hypothetical protein EB796_005337 [Bugula neritina]|uniref:Uncharacterized protein n=1 Tax=Bugula neritina TaxID=10212 RepID=A0A7J7KER3_BUGNE|nr:hypothetical protein EB796_005337 [Bugula neritina]